MTISKRKNRRGNPRRLKVRSENYWGGVAGALVEESVELPAVESAAESACLDFLPFLPFFLCFFGVASAEESVAATLLVESAAATLFVEAVASVELG